MEAALPEQLAGPYGQALTRLQEAAPAMPVRTVHRVLSEQLGPRWRQRFREFDDRPAAAASIGQVHRAVWRDGRVVAVKVQYPGAGDALASDLRQLDRLVPIVRVAAPGIDPRALFSELRARVMAEVDYRQEAEAQAAFASALRDDPDFVVPAVVEVTDRVLVSEWVDGTPCRRWPEPGNGRTGTGPGCCSPGSCCPVLHGWGGCTAIPTQATSASTPTAGSSWSTTAPPCRCPPGGRPGSPACARRPGPRRPTA